jgi:hypothetical protein
MVPKKDEILHNIYHEVTQIRTVLLGIEGTADEGCVGKINRIEEHLGELNGSVQKNTSHRKITWSIILLMLAALIGLGSKIMGVW